MSYTPPAGNAVDFHLAPYTPVAGDEVDFELHGEYTLRLAGHHRVTTSIADRLAGRHRVSADRFFLPAPGHHRVARDDLAGYLLYRSVDDPDIDLDAVPYHTGAALPLETPALALPDPGETATYRFILRRRNPWGLTSRNRDTYTITIDEHGEVVTDAPSAPEQIRAVPVQDGRVRVQAMYLYAQDTTDIRADQWAIYAAEDVDPDPDSASPTLEALTISGDGIAVLDWTSAPYADQTSVHILVRTRRDGRESPNTTAVVVVTDIDGPGAITAARIFFGDVATQNP